MTEESDVDRQIRVVSSLREAGASQAELDALAAVWSAGSEPDAAAVETVTTATGHEVDKMTAESLAMLERRHRLPAGQLMLEMAGSLPVPSDAREVLQEEPSITARLADLFRDGRQAAPRTVTTEPAPAVEWAGELPVPAGGPTDMYRGISLESDLRAVRSALTPLRWSGRYVVGGLPEPV